MKALRLRRITAVAWLLFFLAALCVSAAARADERILSFASDIRIAADGSMLVTETIRVRAEGTNIRRGIYRDFPTRYRDRLGNGYRVEFEVLGLTRDGQREPWFTERRDNGVRVNFGDDTFLTVPAEYEYALTYRTDRQLGFFTDWDELYWNVTGDGWIFPIDAAEARVSLPQPVVSDALDIEGYTGPRGSTERNYSATVADGQGAIRTTAPLGPREGLTLVFSWPKGIVTEPSRAQRVIWLLRDNRGVLVALVALLGTLLWPGNAWWRVGRDPATGLIFPHYEAPDGFSPAAARYVRRMGYDDVAFTAAVVDLAVHGHLLITEEKGKYRLQRITALQPPAGDERALYDKLFAASETLVLEEASHTIVNGAKLAHMRALRDFGFRRYFQRNGLYLLPTLLGSGVLFVWMLSFGVIQSLAMVFFAIVLMLHGLFAWLLRAPTREGRKILDQLDGFRLYLNVAEKDELKLLRAPPQLTPQLFERLLPFAIALGVEAAWAARFERALNAIEPGQCPVYQPVWYAGHFNPARMHDFTRDVGRGLNTAIAAASTPPGGSSGRSGGFGGGGFSGGGGGGGGGGGR